MRDLIRRLLATYWMCDDDDAITLAGQIEAVGIEQNVQIPVLPDTQVVVTSVQ